jgi:hypothetical protein
MYKKVSYQGQEIQLDFRLDTQTALGKRDIIGLGVLLGLEDGAQIVFLTLYIWIIYKNLLAN